MQNLKHALQSNFMKASDKIIKKRLGITCCKCESDSVFVIWMHSIS